MGRHGLLKKVWEDGDVMNPTEKENDTDKATARENTPDIGARIRFKQALLEYMLSIKSRTKNSSDFGWLLSLAAGDVGTLMAVLEGKSSRQFDALIRRLEQEIIDLKVDEKLARLR